MMKKIVTVMTLVIMSFSLVACGNNSQQAKENSSLKAANASLKARSSHKTRSEVKYSNAEYALAAYLKLADQTADDLKSHSEGMNWNQDGNKYAIDFGAHTTVMTVNKDNVEVTYDKTDGDHMGQGNGHKTYSKDQLARVLKDQKNTIDVVLSAHPTNSSNQNTQTSSAKGTTTSQSSNDNDSNYNLPLSDPRNPDGEKQAQMMSIAGDPQYRDTPDGSVNAEGQALMNSIRATMHN